MKDKFIYWIIFCVVILTGIGFYTKLSQSEYIEENYEVEAKSEIWYTMIAKDMNSRDIQISVDGKTMSNRFGVAYMDENLMLKIPYKAAVELFDCSSALYNENKLIIEKGTTKVVVKLNKHYMKVDDEKINLESAMTDENGVVYVPIEVFEKGLGYEVTWDSGNASATLITQNTETRDLPYYYSYVDSKRINSAYDQGNLGTCWAFAALTALETTMMPEDNKVFSVDHMSLKNSFAGEQSDGGEYTMAWAYLASWQGPVLESDDEYGDEYSPDGLEAVNHVQEMQIIDSKDYESIKKMILKYGGVQSSLYTSLTDSESKSFYYNDETYSYCYIGTEKPNHDVVIIGWDDNYSKENFTTDVEGDGAFICRNSWGEDFGDNGDFYVSYYDTNIGVHNEVYTRVDDVDNYDNIYQADLCGWVGNLGYSSSETAYCANVYTAKSDEVVKAVGFYATVRDVEYEVYVCKEFKNTSSLSGTSRVVASGTLENAGYYTIDLDEDIEISKDNKYAVIMKITTPNSTKPIAIEFANDYQTEKVDLSDGEGYFSLDGKNWDCAEDNNCNICLKAYTDNR